MPGAPSRPDRLLINSMNEALIIGIDLGTTHSLVGVVDTGFPIVLADANGDPSNWSIRWLISESSLPRAYFSASASVAQFASHMPLTAASYSGRVSANADAYSPSSNRTAIAR